MSPQLSTSNQHPWLNSTLKYVSKIFDQLCLDLRFDLKYMWWGALSPSTVCEGRLTRTEQTHIVMMESRLKIGKVSPHLSLLLGFFGSTALNKIMVEFEVLKDDCILIGQTCSISLIDGKQRHKSDIGPAVQSLKLNAKLR